MNETEFKALLEAVRTTDADQFETLCLHMAKIALAVGEESADSNWVEAGKHLQEAGELVNDRMGN